MWLLGAIISDKGQPMIELQCSETKFLYYPLLYEWLLWTTIGNKEQPVMNLHSSEVTLHPKLVKQLKIYLKS